MWKVKLNSNTKEFKRYQLLEKYIANIYCLSRIMESSRISI